MNRSLLYKSLYDKYLKAYPDKSKQQSQKDVNDIWNKIKHEDDLSTKVSKLINNYEAVCLKKKGHLMQFWAKSCTKPTLTKTNEQSEAHQLPSFKSTAVDIDKPCSSKSEPLPSKEFKAPAQERLKKEIDMLNADLVGLHKRRNTGMISSEQEQEMKQMEAKRKRLECDLKTKLLNQKRQKKFRENAKRKLAALIEENPNKKDLLNLKERAGRPRFEDNQPLLLKTITDIVIHGSAAHDKRQCDIYRSIKTLDELTEEIKKSGFAISRSGIYLRLLPKRSLSAEGKRHVMTAPVKLIRSQNDRHFNHIDGKFCTSTIRHLEELASVVGPSEVCFISQDDKARVAIGLTAAQKQAPILMHVEYRISLPDHDWVVASKHKLIPSVYAGINIKPDGLGKIEAVGYSGPTYIAVRSGKHSSSTAFAHGLDFERILHLREFDVITKSNNIVKPIIIFTVDGGPDENPRYQKVIFVAIHHFLKHDVDALFIATNAPGRSAFNRVERRMATLSRELSGVILPHNHFGSHLDGHRRTQDHELEKQNFKFAGETLSQIWSSIIFDNYPTVAEYIEPDKSEIPQKNVLFRNSEWFSKHVQTSQYCTQIVKCDNRNCCAKPRSSYFTVMNKKRFLPPPIPLIQTNIGIKAATDRKNGETSNFCPLFLLNSLCISSLIEQPSKCLPYDYYCPSVQNVLKDRICSSCDMYFASQVMLKDHVKSIHHTSTINIKKTMPVRVAARRQRELMAVIALQEGYEDAEWIDEDNIDLTNVEIGTEDNCKESDIPVLSMDEYFTSPWDAE